MTALTGSISGFRIRLFLIIMLLVGLVTVLAATFAQRHLSRASDEHFRTLIEQQVEAAAHTRRLRQAVLAGICRDLAGQPRIHAALEDDALDLLYPSAANELRQIIRDWDSVPESPGGTAVQARFYRFLDLSGRIIPPLDEVPHGRLPKGMEERLNLAGIPPEQQIGYLSLPGPDGKADVVEILAVPIVSTESFEPIAALVVGFPFDVQSDLPPEENLSVALQLGEKVILSGRELSQTGDLNRLSKSHLPNPPEPSVVSVLLDGTPHRLLRKPLNPGSAYPEAHRLFLSSLAPLQQRQARLRAQIVTGAGILLVIGLALAHFSARRLARPVEALAVASEEEHNQRVRAEVALDTTSRELERAARFSADASHQLKTPVAVVRAGLEELLVDSRLPAPLRSEVGSLINQTGRLTRVIEDLLLLSRLDAGRLELDMRPENLRLIIDGLVDDLSILPESEQLEIQVQADDPLWIHGDRIYTSLILQNLLENAHKYNRLGGHIRISATCGNGTAVCRIGNTGRGIPDYLRPHIFERFHRGSTGENVPGYGLGLNMAMELARLHGGELVLLGSADDWTEFALTLRSAQPAPSREDDA